MKKYLTYIIVLLIGAGVFILQFSSNEKHVPNEYYQVYLDNEKIGVIKSKEELNKYIKSQGAVVKQQVEKYSVDVDRIKTVEEILNKVIKKDNNYYSSYQNSLKFKKMYNILFNLVGDNGKIKDNYDKVLKIYQSYSIFNADTTLTEKEITNYEDLKDKIDSSIRRYEDNIIKYVYENRNSFDLTSTERSNLEDYISNNLSDIGYTKYVYMSNYIENNNMYLYADDIFEPLGINVKKINTYKKDYMPVEKVYDIIIEKKPCTIEGYQFKIKKSNRKVINKSVLYGTLAHTDYNDLKVNATEDIIVYVTDPKVFNQAIDEIASVFIGSDEYTLYKDDKQEEIKETGKKIENVYLKEEITIRETNISVREKVFNDSSSLASYLLYGDNVKSNTVYAKSDDTITKLALRNGISVEEFFLSNPSFTSINNIFYDNQPVIIKKLNSKLSLTVDETRVEDKEIEYRVIEKYDNNMLKGDEKVEQEGVNGVMRVRQKVRVVNGSIQYAEPISNETLKNARDKIVLVGTKELPNVGSTSSWFWPTKRSYTLTSYFGWRVHPFNPSAREFHSGLDIAGVGYGAPIYASNNGTIVEINHGGSSYGNNVIIDHNNGYWTNYAHMQSFASGIRIGDTVARGQVIGYVGATGAATGPHLHFEIRVGKNRYANVVDPLPYLRK